MTLAYANNGNRDSARQSLEFVRGKDRGSFTTAQAWDESARHWAYPDTVLADLGYKVACFGDTGSHAFAITECGLYLSSNSMAKHHSDVAALIGRMHEMGAVGKRLHAD